MAVKFSMDFWWKFGTGLRLFGQHEAVAVECSAWGGKTSEENVNAATLTLFPFSTPLFRSPLTRVSDNHICLVQQDKLYDGYPHRFSRSHHVGSPQRGQGRARHQAV